MGKLLGTLVVVVSKAVTQSSQQSGLSHYLQSQERAQRKQRIGKQDPFCTVSLNSDKKRTPTVKKGGQTPEWDCELRFEVWQDAQDEVAAEITATGGVRPSTVTGSVSSTKLADKETAPRVVKSGPGKGAKSLRVAVYADDPRDPDLVGESDFDLTRVLKIGEYDGWIQLTNKGRPTGEVKVEMTFYSAEPEPPKKVHKKLPSDGSYGGPGVFEPLKTLPRPLSVSSHIDIDALPPHLRPGNATSSIGTAGSRLSFPGSVNEQPLTPQHVRSSLSIGGLSEFGAYTQQSGSVSSHNLQASQFNSDRAQSPNPSRLRRSSFNGQASPMQADQGYYQPQNFPQRGNSAQPNASRPLPVQPVYNEGMPQHSVDVLTRPLSTMSLNKPLPAPQQFSSPQPMNQSMSTYNLQAPSSSMPAQRPLRHSMSSYQLSSPQPDNQNYAAFDDPSRPPYGHPQNHAQSYDAYSQPQTHDAYGQPISHIYRPTPAPSPLQGNSWQHVDQNQQQQGSYLNNSQRPLPVPIASSPVYAPQQSPNFIQSPDSVNAHHMQNLQQTYPSHSYSSSNLSQLDRQPAMSPVPAHFQNIQNGQSSHLQDYGQPTNGYNAQNSQFQPQTSQFQPQSSQFQPVNQQSQQSTLQFQPAYSHTPQYVQQAPPQPTGHPISMRYSTMEGALPGHSRTPPVPPRPYTASPIPPHPQQVEMYPNYREQYLEQTQGYRDQYARPLPAPQAAHYQNPPYPEFSARRMDNVPNDIPPPPGFSQQQWSEHLKARNQQHY